MAFTIISAIDEARGIGRQGGLPWSLRGDLLRFKELTIGNFDQGRVNTVIMGRATWNSLPPSVRPMPRRLNIVLTSQAASFQVEPNVLVAASLDQALDLASQYGSGDIFVVGGSKVYAEAIQHPACERLMLTEVLGTHQCDTFFPEIPPVFKETSRSEEFEEAGERYRFLTLQRT